MATTFPGRQPGGGPGYFPQKQNICFSFRDQGKCSKSFCPYLHCLDDSQRNQGVKQQDNIPQQPQYGNKQFSPQGPHIQPVVPQQGPQMPVQSYGHYPQGNQPIGFGVMAAPGRIILLDPAQVPGLFQSHMGNHSGYMGAPINHMGMGSNNQHTRYEQSPVWDNRPQAYQVHNSQPQQPSQFHNQNFAQGPQHHAPSQPQQELYGTYPNSSPTASNFSSHTNNSPQNYPPQNQARTYPTRNTDGVPTEPRNFQQNNHGYKPRYNNRFPRPWENRYPQPVPAQGAQTEPNASTDANPVPLVKPSPIKDIKPAPVPVVEPVPAQEVNPDLARRVQPPPRPIVQEDLIDLLSSSPPEHVKDDKPSSDKTTQVEIHSISRGSSSLSEMNSLMLPPTETVEKKPGTGLSGLKERIQLISSSQQASMKVSPALTELSPTALETYINTPPHLRGKLYPELLQRSRLDQDSVKVSSTDLSEDNDKFTTQAQITTAPTSVTQVDCTTTESNHLSSTVELSENAPSTITSSLMDLKTLDISHSPPTSDNEPSSISQEEQEEEADGVEEVGENPTEEELRGEQEGDLEKVDVVIEIESEKGAETDNEETEVESGDAGDLDLIQLTPPLFFTPSPPILTTRTRRFFGYQSPILTFKTSMSYNEFKRSRICVSSSSFERLYQKHAYIPNHAEDEIFDIDHSNSNVASNSENTRQTSVQASVQASITPTDTPREAPGEILLGPKPRPRRTYQFERSRSPSPDSSKVANDDEPTPLFRIARQHVFDLAYCWNCWSMMHKANDCPEPPRTMEEREELRMEKRVVSKSWARALENMGKKAAIIPVPGMSDEEAFKFQAATPLRHKRKPLNLSPVITDQIDETAPGVMDWWNSEPPVPEISDAEVAAWANNKIPATPPEGTCSDLTWSDTSVDSGTDTSASPKPSPAHMDGASFRSIFNAPSTCGSESTSDSEVELNDKDTTDPEENRVMDPEPTMENEAEEDVEQTETPSLDEISGTVLDEEGMEAEESVKVTEYHDSSEWSNRGFYAGGLLSRGFQPEDWIPEPGFEHLSKPKVRDPRPEEIQKEPTVTFIGSENLHSPRQWGHRATVLSEGEYAFLNLPRGHYRAGHRTYARLFRPGPITKLPFEILTQVVEYVGMAQLDNDPREELLVYDRARAECTRALELRHLRRVNKQLYGVVQKIIYTRVSITSIFDLDRFLRTVQFRERLSSLVIDITVDIPQLKSHQIRFTPPGKMAKSTYSMIRGIYGIFECCKSLTRFAFHCTGAIQAFGKLEGFYPSLRKVVVCDLLDIGKSSEAFWKNLPLFPNLEEVSLVRSEENRDLDHRKWQISPVGKPWISHDYLTLQLLKFSYCPDVSDKILHKMLPSLPNLNKLMLHECKLVTSSGLARLINKMNGRLTELYYYDYVDCSGKVSEEEQKNKRPCHLCPAIAKSPKLQSLTLSAYRLCSVLWDEAYWEDLHTLKIDLMFYTGCENDEDDDKDFRLALLEATREGRLPSLTKEGFFFQTNSPGMIYRRKYKHTEEQIARATGYIV